MYAWYPKVRLGDIVAPEVFQDLPVMLPLMKAIALVNGLDLDDRVQTVEADLATLTENVLTSIENSDRTGMLGWPYTVRSKQYWWFTFALQSLNHPDFVFDFNYYTDSFNVANTTTGVGMTYPLASVSQYTDLDRTPVIKPFVMGRADQGCACMGWK